MGFLIASNSFKIRKKKREKRSGAGEGRGGERRRGERSRKEREGRRKRKDTTGRTSETTLLWWESKKLDWEKGRTQGSCRELSSRTTVDIALQKQLRSCYLSRHQATQLLLPPSCCLHVAQSHTRFDLRSFWCPVSWRLLGFNLNGSSVIT